MKFFLIQKLGLSFNDGHKIVEIACIETKDLIPTGKIFHKLINPKGLCQMKLLKFMVFDAFLKDKETFDKIADDFLNFIKDKKIIIHNASFDLSF